MSLKHGLLGLLHYGSMTGYDLDKAFKDSLNFFWQAQTSQVYRELTNMEKLGWLTSELVIQTDKPNKKVYTITDTGKQELNNWLMAEQSTDSIRVHSEFLMKLFFSGTRSVDENIASLKEYKKLYINKLEDMSLTAKSINEYSKHINDTKTSVYWGLTARCGEMYYKMYIDFITETIEKLEDLK